MCLHNYPKNTKEKKLENLNCVGYEKIMVKSKCHYSQFEQKNGIWKLKMIMSTWANPFSWVMIHKPP